jgi:DNA-binding response OmpR family regulator
MHGLTVCKQLRKELIATPILVVTAFDQTKFKVELLQGGADDYLTKPFNGEELNARVAALIRRQSQPVLTNVMMVNDLELDVSKRQVRRSGVLIPLRRKEFDILEYLVSNRGRAMSRDMIINHAWVDGTAGWNNTVDVHIKHLRDKVDRPFSSALIKTAYGIGYMIDDTD